MLTVEEYVQLAEQAMENHEVDELVSPQLFIGRAQVYATLALVRATVDTGENRSAWSSRR